MQSVGDKVKALRNSKKINQSDMAAFIGVKTDKIVDVEAGRSEYSPRHIEGIKELFDIEGMPLEDSERPAFIMRLYRWRACARDDRMSEAKKMRDELAKVVNLEPCDYDLAMLYKIFEAGMLIVEENFTAAEKKFVLLRNEIEKLSNESLFHYYLKACDLVENNSSLLPEYDNTTERIYYNLAWCYSQIGSPVNAILFLLKIKELNSDNIMNDLGLRIDIMLAKNYIKINNLYEANKILSKCVVKAQGINNDLYVGLTMQYSGLLNWKAEDWKTAISYYDQALKYYEDGSYYYISAIYSKIRCMIDAREFPKAQKLLEQIKIKYGADEYWAVYYEALGHYLNINRRMSIYNKESSEYIENIALPYFEKMRDNFSALHYCQLLELHYSEVKSSRNSLIMSRKIKDIYEQYYVNHKRRTL